MEISYPVGRDVIEAVLPHRDPFVWVSRVLECEPGVSVKAELEKLRAKEEAKAAREAEKEAAREARERAKHQREMVEDVVDAATSFLGQIGREAGSQILRGLFGTRRRR